MVTKQFWCTRTFHINIRQDTREHGLREELTVKLTLEIIWKRGHLSKIIDSAKMTGLVGTGPKMISKSCKMFALHVSMLEKYEKLRLESNSTIFAIFAKLGLLS